MERHGFDLVKLMAAVVVSAVSLAASGAQYEVTNEDELAAALSAQQDGDVIGVAAGEYRMTNTVAITRRVTLRGAGREATVFTGDNLMRNFIAFSMVEGATVKDLSIVGYKKESFASGCGMKMTGGTLDNVCISGIQQGNGQGGVAPKDGTGLYMTGGVVTNCVIEGCLVSGSYGIARGVGIAASGSSLIVDTVIRNNARRRHQLYGAGVYVSGSGVRVSRCRIEGNNSGGNVSSDTCGLGLYMTANALVEDCIIGDNGIQGVWMSNGTLRNCLVTGHANTSGSIASAGVHMEGSAKLYNCTIWGNDAKNANAGLRMTGGTAVNNIVFGNGAAGSAAVTGGTFSTNVVCENSSIPASAVGNFRVDPQLTDPEGGDFSLTLASVALDAAAPIGVVDHDLNLVTRPQGDAPDIGALERPLVGGRLECAVVLESSSFKEGVAVTAVRARVRGAEGEVDYSWYVDGMLTDQTSGEPVFEGLGVGTHSVRLEVSDGMRTAWHELWDVLTIKPATVYVDQEGGEEFPYDTPEKAARNVHDALGAVWRAPGDPGRVMIAKGTYPLAKSVVVSIPCEFVGEGRDATILDGSAISEDRGFDLSGAGTVLRNLTVTGCKSKQDGTAVRMGAGVTLDNVRVTGNSHLSAGGSVGTIGVGIHMSGGTVKNCMIDANSGVASYAGTKGIGVYMTGGLLVDSVICSNTFNRTQHSGIGVYAGGGEVRRCRIFQNRSSANDVDTGAHGIHVSGANTLVEDCIVSSNGWTGVQLDDGTVRNCVIFGHAGNSGKDHWAGVCVKGGKLQNCTLHGNVAGGDTTGRSGLCRRAARSRTASSGRRRPMRRTAAAW